MTFNDGTIDRLLTWDEKGRKTNEGTRQYGSFLFVATEWHENGQKARETSSRDDETVLIVEWDETGQITNEENNEKTMRMAGRY